MIDDPTLAAIRHLVEADVFGCRIVMVSGPDQFSSAVVDADGGYSFTPVNNYNGPVPLITYTVTDGTEESAAASGK